MTATNYVGKNRMPMPIFPFSLTWKENREISRKSDLRNNRRT